MAQDQTVRIDADLNRRMKIQAAKEGKSMKAWLAENIEKALAKKERRG